MVGGAEQGFEVAVGLAALAHSGPDRGIGREPPPLLGQADVQRDMGPEARQPEVREVPVAADEQQVAGREARDKRVELDWRDQRAARPPQRAPRRDVTP